MSELSEAEKVQVVELAKQLDAATGRSDALDHAVWLMNMSTDIPYVVRTADILKAVQRDIIKASMIPAWYFEDGVDSSGH